MTGPRRSASQALSTWIASDGMEACRRACGGHGFSQLSGLPSILQSYVQNVTWEGDNNVMLLQACPTQVMLLSSAGLSASPVLCSLFYVLSALDERVS